MRKILVYTFILCGVLGWVAFRFQLVQAQETTSDVVTLETLEVDDITLRGPYASGRVLFGLPADWQLVSGVQLELDLSTFYGGIGTPTAEGAAWHGLGGSLEVSFNGELVDTVLINEVGKRTVSISIPPENLNSTRRDGLMVLTFFLDAALDCDFDQQTLVVIQNTTRLVLPHESTSPVADLTQLPRPIFQDTFVEESAVLVIPDQPTASELQAALAVSAGFGQMTGGNLLLSFMQASQLTNQVLESSHLIFVGMPEAFPMLGNVSLPASVSGTNYSAAGSAPDDGIVQMAVSPWNSAKVVLVVGGNSEAGVIKAGQAVSTGVVRTGEQPNLALIQSVQPYAYASFIGLDRRLADIGYENNTVNYIGFSTIEIPFYIPAGYTVGVDSYFNLIVAHSALLNYDRSGVVVNLNGQPIGSVRLSDDVAGGSEIQVKIPASAVRAGTNQFTIDVNLVPTSVCLDPRLANLWVRIDSDSSFHLPLYPALGDETPLLDLSQYPEPFSLDPIWNSMAFVLAPNDPNGWVTALQIAADLGDRSNLSLANSVAVYVDAIPDEVRQSRDLFVIGRPSMLPILMELSDILPAFFEADSDLAIEQNLQVAYHLLPGVSVGYIELVTSPWNSQRAVLAVLGSTDEGVQWAGTALVTPRLRGRLAGDLAVINREQIVVTDTRTRVDTESALAAAVSGGVAEVPVTGTAPAVPYERPAWILPTLVGIALLILIVILMTLVKAIRQRRV